MWLGRGHNQEGGPWHPKKLGGDFSTSIEVKKGETTAHTIFSDVRAKGRRGNGGRGRWQVNW
jgi:hypothetical protein